MLLFIDMIPWAAQFNVVYLINLSIYESFFATWADRLYYIYVFEVNPVKLVKHLD